MRRILLTGASGFVGAKLVARLGAEAGCEVLPLEGPAQPGAATRPGAVAVDLAGDPLAPIVRDFAPTDVVHLAAQSSVAQGARDPAGTVEANVVGSLRLAAAVAAEAPGARFLFASSGDVYGQSFASGEPMDEDVPVRPLSVYARTKASGEWLIPDLLDGRCPFVALRLFNHIGPGQSEAFAAPSFAAQLARMEAGLVEPVLRVGDLDVERDFLDVRDVLEAYVAVFAAAIDQPRLVLNVASGRPRTIRGLLDGLIALSGVRPTVEPAAERFRAAEIRRACGSPARIHALTGWSARIPIEQSLAAMLDDWRGRVR